MRVAVSVEYGRNDADMRHIERYYYPVPLDYDYATNGAINVTTFTTLRVMYNLFRIDYKQFRSGMYALVIEKGGFSYLTVDEKDMACRHFIVLRADRDTLYTLEDQIDQGVVFHGLSVECRHERRKRAEAEIYGRLSSADQMSVMNDTAMLLENYVKFGVEGTLEGDVEGLFDYIESRVGTSFAATGLLNKGYIIDGMTLADLSARLMNILKNGAK